MINAYSFFGFSASNQAGRRNQADPAMLLSTKLLADSLVIVDQLSLLLNLR